MFLQKPIYKIVFYEYDLLDIDLFCIIAYETEKTKKTFVSRTLDFYKKVFHKNA